jgi:hypothetical protein
METSPLTVPGPETWAEQFSASLHAQRDRAREFLAAQQMRLEKAEIIVEQELHQLEEELRGQRDQADRLRVARDALAARLAQTESRLAEAEKRLVELPDDGDHRAADEDLQRRYELALDDLRQSKNRNTELQQQLVKTRSTAAKLAQQARQPGRLDWEAEKQRILAALEADFDEDDEAQQTERLRIAEVLQTTDEVIAAKDREIQELKQRLEDQSPNGAADVPDMVSADQALDNDAVVREERERLKRLQEEWREKLQQAQVELALERAKIARQRAELEELRTAENDSPQPPSTTDADGQTERSTRGRWLARLGLTEADREPGRHL